MLSIYIYFISPLSPFIGESSYKPNGFIEKVSKYFGNELLRSGLRSLTLRTRRSEAHLNAVGNEPGEFSHKTNDFREDDPEKRAIDDCKFGKSGNTIIDDFILEKKLRWIPYNKFKNVGYLSKGGFGIIFKATWLNNDENEEVILKCRSELNENLNEFLKECEYHTSILSSNDIIEIYGFTKDPDTLKYMVVIDYANKGNLRENLTKIVENNWNQKLFMLYQIVSGLSKIHEQNLIHCDFHDGNILIHRDKKDKEDKVYICDFGLCQPVKSFLIEYDYYGVLPCERPEIVENTPQCYVDLMKKCWNEDPLKRPSSKEVLKIIEKWIFHSYEVSEELKSNIMEFINAPIGQHNNLVNESHPQACYTSRLLDFTSKKLNEILESEDLQANVKTNEILVSEYLNDYIIRDLKSLDIEADENTSENLNEILESEDSQASVKANEILVSEYLNDYIIRDLKSLDENTSKKLNETLESEYSQASVKANEMLVSEDLSDYIIKDLESLGMCHDI
ncbi:unnamed protein product [Rhizophagus irregularis]|nr:unnamed protein product [Rhizophagus irregularis]